jgi:hypothetical protein
MLDTNQGRLGQRLWMRLERVGLLDRSQATWEDEAFVAAGNGLTDLVKRPTASASGLSARELAAGATVLAENIRDWKPGLLLFAFRPPAEALLGSAVRPGVGLAFAGTLSFLLAPHYAATSEVDLNLRALRRLLKAAK